MLVPQPTFKLRT